MRLINTESLTIESFFGKTPPPYAIFSHTWEDGEVVFEKFDLPEAKHKQGYQKILSACSQAKSDGYKYIWIDTCCIDKRSSAELSEAINSMFLWYREAIACYAFLSDVQFVHAMKDAKWFTRGWTLQELIAPVEVRFFSAKWGFMGTRGQLAERISEITGIDVEALQSPRNFDFVRDASIAQKMSWAAKRTTTRVEDIAYCLLGLFDVNLALLYGERENAFIRLQEEIMRHSTDQSLFAWYDDTLDALKAAEPVGLLASSPKLFLQSGNIRAVKHGEVPFQITNRALVIELPLLRHTKHSRTRFIATLACYRADQPLGGIQILLRAVKPNDARAIRMLARAVGFPLLETRPEGLELVRVSASCISVGASAAQLQPRCRLNILRHPPDHRPRQRVLMVNKPTYSLHKSPRVYSPWPSMSKSELMEDFWIGHILTHNTIRSTHGSTLVNLPSIAERHTCLVAFGSSSFPDKFVVRVHLPPQRDYSTSVDVFIGEESIPGSSRYPFPKQPKQFRQLQVNSGLHIFTFKASLSWQSGFGQDILNLDVDVHESLLPISKAEDFLSLAQELNESASILVSWVARIVLALISLFFHEPPFIIQYLHSDYRVLDYFIFSAVV